MKDLIKNFFVYGLGATISKFLTVLLLPIYASVFTPVDYGNMDFVISVGSIFSVFGLIQIDTSLQRFYYDYPDLREKYLLVYTTLRFTLLASLLVTIIALCITNCISKTFLNGEYFWEIVVCILNIIPVNLNTIFFIDIRFREKSMFYMIFNCSIVIFTAILSIVSVKLLNWGIMGVIASTTVVSWVFLAIIYIYWRKDREECYSNKEMLRKMMIFGLPMFPARLGSISNAYINRFFLISLFSSYALGIYSISLKVASVMQLFLMAFQLAWLPYMYKVLKQPNHQRVISEILNKAHLLILCAILLLSLFSREIVLLLTNEEYIESYKYVSILSYYYGLYILKEIVDVGVNVTKKTSITTYIFAASTVVNVAALFLLTPLVGIWGVCIALVLSNLILYYTTMVVSEKLYPIGFSFKISVIADLITILSISILVSIDLEIKTRCIILAIICIPVGHYIIKQVKQYLIFKSRSKYE